MPVEQMIGLPRDATSRISGRCQSSYDAILNALTPRSSSRSTASWSNGVDRKSSPALGRVLEERRVPLARQLELAEQLGHRLAGGQDAVEVLRPRRRLGDDPVGAERLELDRVRPSLGGDVDQPLGLVEVPVVVRAGLGDDVDRRAATDRPIADPDDIHRAGRGEGFRARADLGRTTAGRR